jgi:hypothetical protein
MVFFSLAQLLAVVHKLGIREERGGLEEKLRYLIR